MNIEQVKEYIESEGLNQRSREQFYVFRRHYLCYALYRTQELTLSEIGKIFNRDHSTVLHSIRKHEELKNDRLYQKKIESCIQLMSEPLTFSRQKRNIFEDIAKATNYEKLRRIRRWLNEGRYDHQIPKELPSRENWEKIGLHIKNSFPQAEQNPM
jgi:hypothetical protein